MVDLRASDPRVLARYLGQRGASSFLAHHGVAGLLAADTRSLRRAS
jgi:hypothetical protein